MPTREEILRKKTHKDDGLELEERIFYTLYDENKEIALPYVCKSLSLLFKILKEKKIISDSDIDEILFKTVT